MPDDEAINEMIARSEEEFEIYQVCLIEERFRVLEIRNLCIL